MLLLTSGPGANKELSCVVRIFLSAQIHIDIATTLLRVAIELQESSLIDVCSNFVLAHISQVASQSPMSPAQIKHVLAKLEAITGGLDNE